MKVVQELCVYFLDALSEVQIEYLLKEEIIDLEFLLQNLKYVGEAQIAYFVKKKLIGLEVLVPYLPDLSDAQLIYMVGYTTISFKILAVAVGEQRVYYLLEDLRSGDKSNYSLYKEKIEDYYYSIQDNINNTNEDVMVDYDENYDFLQNEIYNNFAAQVAKNKKCKMYRRRKKANNQLLPHAKNR